ncbi:MAG: CHAT domain-containing protein [Spirochaetales bacterium]|nr:CHAT domain-containing protein [Spirochaetales bacterium]
MPQQSENKNPNYPETDTIKQIKSAITSNWKTDREHAFSLYEKLLELEKENKKDKQSEHTEHTDKEYIIKLAEKYFDSESIGPELLETALSEKVITYIKKQIDAFRWQDNTKAIAYAQEIIRIGEYRGDSNQKAFGLMCLGDSMVFTGDQLKEAWKIQHQGAKLYLQTGNLMGWALTTIGRVGICIELECVDETLKEAKTALEFFKRYNHQDYFVRLSINIMRLLNEIGQYDEALSLFNNAFTVTTNLKENKEMHLLILYNNAGITYWQKGEFNRAFDCLLNAKDLAAKLNKTESVTVILTNIAYIENMRGNYNEALRLTDSILSGAKTENTLYILRTKRIMADCYLNLNRDQEAFELARTIISDLSLPGKKNLIDLAHAFHLLGTIEAKKGMFKSSEQSFKKAKDNFLALQCDTWAWYTELLRGKILLMRGEYKKALDIADDSITFFKKSNQNINLSRAYLFKAECLIGLQQYDEALSTGKTLLKTDKPGNIFSIYYNTYIMMGRAEEVRGNDESSKRFYNKAIEKIEGLQQNLTITIRPEFLEDKCDGIHSLIRLLLAHDNLTEAYETVERLKSMTILGYLANRKRLYWSEKDPESRELIRELRLLRNDYNCLYRLYQEKPSLQDDDPALETKVIETRINHYETRMRAIIEKLYLLNAKKNRYIPIEKHSLKDTQLHLPENSFLIQYYSNGEAMWAFIIEEKTEFVYKFPVTISHIGELLEKYYDNINYALQEGIHSPILPNLTRLARRLGRELYNALIQPFEHLLRENKQLLIVPFGLLHYIPFNILYNGKSFLVEQTNLSILPSAGILFRPHFSKKPGMVILAHAGEGEITNTIAEAKEISTFTESELYCNKEATPGCLESTPKQILHIVAHGKHRIDYPELSYIQLEDGYLYADDLLQKELDYELVTLSACETGKTMVKKSEEMIGLIRGVLFAGAQSIVVSMWRIDDNMTVQLMKSFYRALFSGKSKVLSLCTAQREIIETYPNLHPAFWGAFQLIGHSGPLSHQPLS